MISRTRSSGFHTALNFLALLGKKYRNSGLEDLLIESGVYAGGTRTALMKGKSYNRAVRAHKLVTEALFRIMWQVLLDWMRRSRREIEKDKVEEKRDVCKHALESRKRVPESVEELKSEMKELLAIFNTFREEFSCKFHLFAFWNEYITMVCYFSNF